MRIYSNCHCNTDNIPCVYSINREEALLLIGMYNCVRLNIIYIGANTSEDVVEREGSTERFSLVIMSASFPSVSVDAARVSTTASLSIVGGAT